MGYLVLLLPTLLVLGQGFNLKTRQLCCSLGTNYSSSGQGCRTFQTPIPGVPIEDEKACLNTVDFCCKKGTRVIQCNEGKNDAKSGSCVEDDGDRKDCCDACRMGIEAQRSGDPCVDTLQLGSPYTEAFVHCCKNPSSEQNKTTSTTQKILINTTIKPARQTESVISAESAKYTKPAEEGSFYPGLSEENVCETGEYCAQLCEPSGKAYKCSCFPGYELMKDGVSCKPLKRAKGSRCEENNPCDHDCIDTGTSVECSCRSGYELGADKKTCKDINECALGIHECEAGEECENDDGTYFCFITEVIPAEEIATKCPQGHKFNADKSICDDIDECEFDLICPPPKTCKNVIGSFICEGPDCPPGFTYRASIETCTDIDECVTGDNNCNKHSEICVNTKGNYTCVDKASRQACPPGFKKNDETLQCEDINECKDELKVCLPDEICENEEGGYQCKKRPSQPVSSSSTTSRSTTIPTCPKGMKFNFDRSTCDDINECQLRVDNCSPAHRCDNTIGSFYCSRIVSCGTGYTLNSAKDLCEDDDECLLGTHNCYDLGPNYQCKNQMGTYKCDYVRPTFRTTATVPTTTSTTTSTTSTTPSTSRTTPYTTSVTTTPTPRVISSSTQSSLRPIPITNPWGEPFYGRNRKPWWYYPPTSKPVTRFVPYTTPASTRYSANPYIYTRTTRPYPIIFSTTTTNVPIINDMSRKCLQGYRMTNNGDCEDIDECENNPCARGTKCINYKGGFQCSSPHICKVGYELTEAGNDCVDVDECAKGTHSCSPSQICKNGDGYYTCECPPGHHLDRNTQVCEDLDECKYYLPCGNYAICENTIGSYKCSCKPGFRMNRQYCDDLNECLETPDVCEDRCINIYGSYKCGCKPGYTLNSDNKTCSDINECELFKDRRLCIGHCVNIPGSYTCDCPNGYTLSGDKRGCNDIDECKNNVCGPQDACLNTNGGYKCFPISCNQHYVKDPYHKARCKRLNCDSRDNQCSLLPEQYSYQFLALVSNLPLSDDGIVLYKIKGPDWNSARAEFSLRLLEVNAPSDVPKMDESYMRKVMRENNLMQLNLQKSIQGPQEVKLQVEMKLYQGGNLIGSVVVYIIIVVSEHPF